LRRWRRSLHGLLDRNDVHQRRLFVVEHLFAVEPQRQLPNRTEVRQRLVLSQLKCLLRRLLWMW
jgi:hypothetical protein